MGILNVTPDSFADGGKNFETQHAINRGLEMIDEGVDIIDVGGESTRPGAERVSAAEEEARVLPVIRGLVGSGVTISIDTMRASTAKLAVEAGATIVNDVSGGAADPNMFSTVAALGCKYTIMHWRGHSKDMNSKAIYGDVVSDVISELQERISAALDAGIQPGNLIIDPGLGFAKEAEHNWKIVDSIDKFVELGYPVLIGASRKRFLGGESPDEREQATIELTKRLATTGIWAVRVHSVKPHREVLAQ